MDASRRILVRLWRTFKPGADSLARPSDRFQASVLVLFILFALAAVPFAASIGSETHARQAEQAREQVQTRYQSTATLLTDGPALSATGRSASVGGEKPTEATWTLPNGVPRFGKVPAEEGALKGAVVPVWLDRDGNPVDAPITEFGAVVDGIAAGAGSWLGLCLTLLGIYGLTSLGLNRARLARWQWEWDREQDRKTRF
ncbi:Rv1733c family protein [Amycolatopsis sp. CA-230715]|uniref:Rv1733c family protein n=1 Tax=Amycolatopsis sp. CA-230715 TaxID=2745196 RepID=UPI001C013B5B|nr:hypothetical protein [Amycolatopsis sp. CA-230715]QWF77954.1 hypothetical protein HUW46_01347 [Amycolatopsis sp. CA-230715]